MTALGQHALISSAMKLLQMLCTLLLAAACAPESTNPSSAESGSSVQSEPGSSVQPIGLAAESGETGAAIETIEVALGGQDSDTKVSTPLGGLAGAAASGLTAQASDPRPSGGVALGATGSSGGSSGGSAPAETLTHEPPARPAVGGYGDGSVPQSKLVELIVLHTNDTHGQVLPRDAFWTNIEGDDSGGIVRLGAEIARQRELAAEAGAEVLLLDGGDWFQGTPEGVTDTGVPYVSMLSSFGYDAMAAGNHDFDFGIAPFERILAAAHPPVVAANVFLSEEPDAGRPDWAIPYRIVERCGFEIALVGFITPSTPVISNPETRVYDFRDPIEVFGQVAAELPDTVDLILPLGHLGVETDRALAQAYPDLPLIVGGHSHSMLRNGLQQGETLIVQTGHKASNLGHVKLKLKRTTGEVVEASARLIELYDDPQERYLDPAVVGTATELVEAVAEAMDQVVGTVTDVGPRGGDLRSEPLGTWVAAGMRRRMDADVGLHNRGGVRKALEVGPVTRRDLFEVLPFDNSVVAFEVTGAELDAVFRGCLDGRRSSRIDVAGVWLDLDVDSAGRASYLGAQVGGMPLDPERTYRIATNSYLARGGDAVFESLGEMEFDDSGDLIRDVMEAELRAAGELALPTGDAYRRGRGIQTK